MKALITGATSGIGRDIAFLLSQRGYDLILASRNTDKMEQIKRRLATNVMIVTVDLSKEEDCKRLYEQVKNEDISILINNAGFGAFGEFSEIPLETELNMIDLNIKAVHYLTKLFLIDFRKKNRGHILNVASSAGFLPGPLMATYYATKAYVLRLTQGIYEELRQEGSAVKVSALCPGPVKTAFGERANVNFKVRGLKSRYVARYALDKMFEGRLVIIPGVLMKAAYYIGRLLPEKLLIKIAYEFQKKKSLKQ